MTTIQIRNGTSQILTDPTTLKAVRELVSYRALDLPPLPVQKVIVQARREGMIPNHPDALFEELWGSPEFSDRLRALGETPSTLTRTRLANFTTISGIWDGWKTLVGPRGHFGTGLVDHVSRAVTLRLKGSLTVEDLRRYPPPVGPAETRIPLFEFQREALASWLASRGGVVNFPPRSGKTRIAIAAVDRLGLPTLMVVPTKNLVSQTVARFREWFDAADVVGITGGRPNPKLRRQMNRALVWVATPPTAAGVKPVRRGERRRGMAGIESRMVLILDEFHHTAADTWQDISAAAHNAYWRMGLTGTHYRADGADLVMHSVLARCVARKTVTEMVQLGRLAPARIAMLRVPNDGRDNEWSGREVYRACVVDHDGRNQAAAYAIRWLLAGGKRVLVIVKEIRHGETIAEGLADLAGSGVVIRNVRGGEGSDAAEAALQKMGRGEVDCVIGTSVIGEGVDVPAADALVYLAGGKSRVKVVQDYFRVLTTSEGKTHGIIVDFADNHHHGLTKAAAQRLALYRSEPEFKADVINTDEFPAWAGLEAKWQR